MPGTAFTSVVSIGPSGLVPLPTIEAIGATTINENFFSGTRAFGIDASSDGRWLIVTERQPEGQATPREMPRVRLFERLAGVLSEVASPFAGGAYEQLGTLTANNWRVANTFEGDRVAAAWAEVRISPDLRWVAFGSLLDSAVQITRFRPDETPPLEVVRESELPGAPELATPYFQGPMDWPGPVRLGWSHDSRYLVAVSHLGGPRWWQTRGGTISAVANPPGEPDIDWVSWAPGEQGRQPSIAGHQRVQLHNRTRSAT